MRTSLHWMDVADRAGKPHNSRNHYNRPRIDAETILKLVSWKNRMLGVHRSLHEESLIEQEKNSQDFA